VHDYPVGTRVEVTLDAGHPLRWFPAGEEAPATGATGTPGAAEPGAASLSTAPAVAGPGRNGATGTPPRVRVTRR
ncbi:MAG TPA: hypothetical protein VIK92_05820, partial [Thermaerobacter sp.]